MWQPGGAYLDVLSAYTQKGRFPAPTAFIPQGLQTAIYFTAEDQIYKIEPVLNGQDMASQLFLKKMIYDDPREVNHARRRRRVGVRRRCVGALGRLARVADEPDRCALFYLRRSGTTGLRYN